MNVLYVFSGERTKRFVGKAGVDFPDTQFYGMNHLRDFGIHAEYKEFEDYPFGRFIRKLFGFRIKHMLMYFIAIRYDLVFGISVMYMLVWKKFFKTKTKFVIFNSNINRLLMSHIQGTLAYRILVSLLKEADGIVFLSDDQMNIVTSKLPFLKEKSHVLLMGVDEVFYKPVYDGRDNYFLSVGRDNARDYKTVVEVARMLPHEEFRFVCLPRNIEGIQDIPQNVKIYENIALEELEALYKGARALLLIMHNDTYLEGSDSSGPTVLLEAMATGLPVVVSNKGYIKDYMVHGEEGIAVDFYDREGQWHMHGLPVLPHSALNHLDVVFNALHGHYGEDGKVECGNTGRPCICH
jgi:glycosyltransferase involved in cell wall biosynthesis